MNKWVLSAVLLVAVALALFFWFRTGDDRYSSDPEVAAAQKRFDEVVSEAQSSEQQPSGQNIIRVEDSELGEKIFELDEDQQQEMTNSMIPRVMGMMEKQFRGIIDLPPNEQREAIDKIIDQQQRQAAAVQQMLDEADEEGGAVTQKVAVDGNSEDGQRWLMDNMTPEQRATMEVYIDLVKARMKERGIRDRNVPIRIAVGVGGP